MADTQIRPLTPEDLLGVAKIHLAAFPESALSALGIEATKRYYAWQLLGPHEVTALAATSGDELIGFCFGGLFRGAMSGFLQKNRTYLLKQVILRPWLLTNPLFRDRLNTAWRSLKRLRKITRTSPVSPSPISPSPTNRKSFGILAIAVNPALHGKGAGKLLMAAAEQVARAQAFPAMDLTVNPDNHQAIRFYETLGWSRLTASDQPWRGTMIKSLV